MSEDIINLSLVKGSDKADAEDAFYKQVGPSLTKLNKQDEEKRALLDELEIVNMNLWFDLAVRVLKWCIFVGGGLMVYDFLSLKGKVRGE